MTSTPNEWHWQSTHTSRHRGQGQHVPMSMQGWHHVTWQCARKKYNIDPSGYGQENIIEAAEVSERGLLAVGDGP